MDGAILPDKALLSFGMRDRSSTRDSAWVDRRECFDEQVNYNISDGCCRCYMKLPRKTTRIRTRTTQSKHHENTSHAIRIRRHVDRFDTQRRLHTS